MLTSFSISGFKSVSSDVSLTLAPLTIIVGANSSGKSSLLQAFLLLSQSAQLPSSDLVLDFNGLFQNLGTLNEVQSRPGYRALSIACGMTVPESRRRVVHVLEPNLVPRSATYHISVSPSEDPTSRGTRVDTFELTVRDTEGSEAILCRKSTSRRLPSHTSSAKSAKSPHTPCFAAISGGHECSSRGRKRLSD